MRLIIIIITRTTIPYGLFKKTCYKQPFPWSRWLRNNKVKGRRILLLTNSGILLESTIRQLLVFRQRHTDQGSRSCASARQRPIQMLIWHVIINSSLSVYDASTFPHRKNNKNKNTLILIHSSGRVSENSETNHL